MLLRQIKYFQTVVRLGSFSKAADECFISQSAVSQQVQALERELGVTLLVRENRRFSLTPAGEYFYNKSLFLTEELERLCRETARLAGQQGSTLRLGYLSGYGGRELQRAIAAFTAQWPNVSVDISHGTHEDLYDLLRQGEVDIVLNDQRRAFSDEYVNCILTTVEFDIEIAARNPIACLNGVEVSDLKRTPCILVASSAQRDNERAYYRDVVGFGDDFLFADNLDEARLLVLSGKGFMPVEGGVLPQPMETLRRIPLLRNGKPITRNYCAFWKADSTNQHIEAFAKLLKAEFDDNRAEN